MFIYCIWIAGFHQRWGEWIFSSWDDWLGITSESKIIKTATTNVQNDFWQIFIFLIMNFFLLSDVLKGQIKGEEVTDGDDEE